MYIVSNMRQSTAACEESGVRLCTQCQSTLPLADFYRTKGKFSGRCKTCTKAASRANQAKNRDKRLAYHRQYYKENFEAFAAYNARYRKDHPEQTKDTYLRYNYGISLEQYNGLLLKQNNSCAGCLRSFSPALVAAVDHEHKTGAVRGLLCSFCNRALGLVRDDPATLRRMCDYVQQP